MVGSMGACGLAESAVIEDAGRGEDAITLMKAAESDPDRLSVPPAGDSYRRNSQFGPSRDAYMTDGRDTGGLHRSLGVALIESRRRKPTFCGPSKSIRATPMR